MPELKLKLKCCDADIRLIPCVKQIISTNSVKPQKGDLETCSKQQIFWTEFPAGVKPRIEFNVIARNDTDWQNVMEELYTMKNSGSQSQHKYPAHYYKYTVDSQFHQYLLNFLNDRVFL